MTQGGGEADTKYNMGASMRVVDRISSDEGAMFRQRRKCVE